MARPFPRRHFFHREGLLSQLSWLGGAWDRNNRESFCRGRELIGKDQRANQCSTAHLSYIVDVVLSAVPALERFRSLGFSFGRRCLSITHWSSVSLRMCQFRWRRDGFPCLSEIRRLIAPRDFFSLSIRPFFRSSLMYLLRKMFLQKTCFSRIRDRVSSRQRSGVG